MASDEQTPRLTAEIYPNPSIPTDAYPAIAAALQSFVDHHLVVNSSSGTTHQKYIWYREPLCFTVGQRTDSQVPYITASMRHGGSIEDEWLAVHLLVLTTQSPLFSLQKLLSGVTHQPLDNIHGPGLVVDIQDEDGLFPLIEAAEVLPNWIQPSNAGRRLWLIDGKFHLIPPQTHLGDETSGDADEATFDETKPLKVSTALHVLYQGTSVQEFQTSPPFFKSLVSQRMPSFPSLDWAMENQHTTLVYLPEKAARVFRAYPQIVSTVAEAFQAREGPGDARRLRDMVELASNSERSDVHSAKSDGDSLLEPLLVPIHLPRRLYATLLAERYFPPKAFGSLWRDSVMAYWQIMEEEMRQKSALSPQEDSANIDTKERERTKNQGRRRDLGCKLACGLELLFGTMKDRRRANPKSLFYDGASIRSTLPYAQFIKSLTALGYFGDSIQDSQEWKTREEKAFQLWKSTASSPSENAHDHVTDDVILSLDSLGTLPPHPLQHQSTAGEAVLSLQEDPDDFLYDLPFDDKGESQNNEYKEGMDEDEWAEREAMKQINAFSEKLQGFVEGKGDATGALFEDEYMENDEDDSDTDSVVDARRQVEAMSPEARQKAMENIVPALKEGEWGVQYTDAPRPVTKSNGKNANTPFATVEKEMPMTVDEEIQSEAVQEDANVHRSGTLRGFSRHVRYEGASDSEESVDDEILRAGETEDDRQSRAHFLGLEKELSEQNEMRRMAKEDGDLADSDNDDDEGDYRLGQDDLKNFLDFTRRELGLSEEQYEAILSERRERGAYVPDFNNKQPTSVHKNKAGFANKQRNKVTPSVSEQPSLLSDGEGDEEENEHESFPGVDEYGVKSSQDRIAYIKQKRVEKDKALRNQRTSMKEKDRAKQRADKYLSTVELQSRKDSDAADENSFSRLMDAMDDKLAHLQSGSHEAYQPDSTENHQVDTDDLDEDMNDLSAQDAELLEKMLHSGPPASLQSLLAKEGDADHHPLGLSETERSIMHSMLRSYQSQNGSAGPVGALAGRLGVDLPHNSE